ncbi:MAG TPA: hypothetical protein DEH78_21700 [Solibacterales bacterium]|nr:hypothetical protein [Bryobacterales bacterium]
MRRMLIAVLFPACLCAGWSEFRSGPFDILTDAGDQAGRAALTHFEQLRHTLGTLLGMPDVKPVWPVRVIVLKNAKDRARYAGGGAPALGFAREEFVGSMVASQPVPSELNRAIVRMLIETNVPSKMQGDIEGGLADLLSTLEVPRPTRINIGAAPPVAQRTAAWARLQMLSTLPEYTGKLRVLLSNLARGIDPEPAFRNAFGKDQATIDKEAAAHLQAGAFETAPFNARPLDPEKQFKPREVEDAEVKRRLADLLLADPARSNDARAACQAIQAVDCLGILNARLGNAEGARAQLETAVKDSRNAFLFAELAKVTLDDGAAKPLLDRAIELNPRWSEPHKLLAARETNPNRKAAILRTAAGLEPRNFALWKATAEAMLPLNQFGEAAKAWAAAERAAETPEQRDEIRRARNSVEERRAEEMEAARKRAAEEEARAMQKLKDDHERRVREAEARANAGREIDPNKKVEKWWDGAKGERVEGLLQRVDCVRGQARLTLTVAGKPLPLLVKDPAQVALIGQSGQTTLGCGVQKPPRPVVVEYQPAKPIGEVTLIEFR